MTENEKAVPDKSSDKESAQNAPPLNQKPTLGGKSPENKKRAERKNVNWSLRILALLLIFMSGAAISIYFMPELKERLPIVARWIGDKPSADLTAINQRLARQQTEIDTLKQQSSDLEARLSQTAQSAPVEISQDLEARISALEAGLNVAPEPQTAVTSNVADSSQSTRVDMLLSRMSQLEASFVPLSKSMIDAARAEKERQTLITDSSSLADKVTQLESRLIGVEQVAAKDNSDILLNLKIAELKRKLLAGNSYSAELQTVRNLLENGSLSGNSGLIDDVNLLSAKASTGIRTADQLRHDFNALIPKLLSTEGIDENASWWQNTLTSLKNMITVRKTDGTSLSEDSLDGLIAGIEESLRNGNFKTALDIVEQLPPVLTKTLSAWTSGAKSWLQSGEAINSLESAAAENYLASPNTSEQGTIS